MVEVMTIGPPSVSRNEGIDMKGWALDDTLKGRVVSISRGGVDVVQIRELGS
jgi:hypothetical protein